MLRVDPTHEFVLVETETQTVVAVSGPRLPGGPLPRNDPRQPIQVTQYSEIEPLVDRRETCLV